MVNNVVRFFIIKRITYIHPKKLKPENKKSTESFTVEFNFCSLFGAAYWVAKKQMQRSPNVAETTQRAAVRLFDASISILIMV